MKKIHSTYYFVNLTLSKLFIGWLRFYTPTRTRVHYTLETRPWFVRIVHYHAYYTCSVAIINYFSNSNSILKFVGIKAWIAISRLIWVEREGRACGCISVGGRTYVSSARQSTRTINWVSGNKQLMLVNTSRWRPDSTFALLVQTPATSSHLQ